MPEIISLTDIRMVFLNRAFYVYKYLIYSIL